MKLINFLFALIFCATLFSVNAQHVSVLSPDEFERGLSRPEVQILDVRTSGEFQNSHIKSSFQADWTDPDQFKDRVQHLDKNKPVMIYCAAGGRSSAAASWMRQNGFKNVKELKGGMTAWNAGNKRVERLSKNQMKMEQYALLLKGKKKVLVDFGAEWCPPCRKMEPILRQLQADLPRQFELVKIDGGVHSDIMKDLHVQALPTLILYDNGRELWRTQGVADIREIKSQLMK